MIVAVKLRIGCSLILRIRRRSQEKRFGTLLMLLRGKCCLVVQIVLEAVLEVFGGVYE